MEFVPGLLTGLVSEVRGERCKKSNILSIFHSVSYVALPLFVLIQYPSSPFSFRHVFQDLGGAYGTMRAGQGMMAMGIRSPDLLMKNIIPVVMAGVLGIYGLM